MPDQPGSIADRLAEIQTDYSGLWTCDDPDWRDAFLRDQVPWLLAEHGRLTAELDEARARAEQAEAAFAAAEDRGDRMRDEAEHWAERCAEVVDERESAEAALAEAMRIQRVQTGQVEAVRRLHPERQIPTAPDGYTICPTCDRGPGVGHQRWPCPTITALAAPADAPTELAASGPHANETGGSLGAPADANGE